MANDLITQVRARGIAAADLITRIRVRTAVPVTVTPPAGGTLEPGELVTLTASASTLPDSWSWTQQDGYPVSLGGAGQSRTFTAPFTRDGTSLIFQVAATKSGTTALATVTYLVRPHTMHRIVGGQVLPSVLTV